MKYRTFDYFGGGHNETGAGKNRRDRREEDDRETN